MNRSSAKLWEVTAADVAAATLLAIGCGGSGTLSNAPHGVTDAASDAGASVYFDRGPQSDPEIAYTVTLQMAPFSVAPSQEVYVCQSYANPFQGQQVDIKSYDLQMEEGSHHMFLFYLGSASDGSVGVCPQGGLSFSPFTFAAQSQRFTQTYPQGVGATIPTSMGFYMNVHYINATSAPIQTHVQVTMYIAKPGVITEHAGVIFLNNTGLSVPATNQPEVVTKSYTLQQDVNILSFGSHMHQRATHFVATTSTGLTLFETDQWADPAAKQYSPPLHLAAGTTITWSCTYVDDTSAPLMFGDSAASNVMCIGVSPFYPVTNVENPVLGNLP